MSLWENDKKEGQIHNDKPEHSEEIFIDCLVARNAAVSVYLLSGTRLTGHLVGADEFSILISKDSHPDHLVYKHSIASICPDFKKEGK